MRVRSWVLVVALVLALGLGFLGRGLESQGLETTAGFLWFLVIILAIAQLPFWRQVLPPLAPMPGLFAAPAEGQRWCTHCGSPTQQEGPCEVCKTVPRARKA